MHILATKIQNIAGAIVTTVIINFSMLVQIINITDPYNIVSKYEYITE